MVRDAVARNFTGGFGLDDYGNKIPPLIVAEEVLDVAGEPLLDAALGLLGVSF